MGYISSNANRWYCAREEQYGKIPAASAAHRIPAVRMSAHHGMEKSHRRDKSGTRTWQGVPDGMRVDKRGNLCAAGPGGILVLTPQGKHIGTIRTGQPTANCAFGDDGSTLYITANNQLLRVRLSTTGVGF